MDRRIWELCSDPNRYLCVQPADLLFFHGKFDGRHMAEEWVTPPYILARRSKKVADLTSWMIGSKTFLVTDRARDSMAELCGSAVEFLPFDHVKGKDLHAVNVVRMEDYIDHEAEAFIGDNFGLGPAYFRKDLPCELPPIFKCGPDSATYVSSAFGEMAVREGLTGVHLADPAKVRLRQILDRLPINEYPGL